MIVAKYLMIAQKSRRDEMIIAKKKSSVTELKLTFLATGIILFGFLISSSCTHNPNAPNINVLFTGDFADPSIVRDSDTFYMTHTSYAYLPGLQIWKSSDLENWTVECFCLESPKLTYHDGFYYLVSAQGGTSGPSTSHMYVVARSISPEGPWENSPYNPLVHTFEADEPWISKGHGTKASMVFFRSGFP